MRFQICHKTHFEYERDAYQSHNEVRLQPADRPQQRCLEFRLDTLPPSAIIGYRDFFNNQAHSISLGGNHRSFAIVARSLIEKAMMPDPERRESTFSRFLTDDLERSQRFYEFLAPSRFVPFSERLRKFFWMGLRPRGAEDVAEYVMRVVSYVRDQFEYETNKTHVFSSLNDILKSGGGVCQDFAHLTIGLLRLAGVPARYVSGYLAPRDQGAVTEQATHAWLEAWIPDAGWTGYDPTHRCRTDERHLVVAVGRDYHDVPPIRGSYRSRGSRSIMRVELSIEIADTGLADGPDQQ